MDLNSFPLINSEYYIHQFGNGSSVYKVPKCLHVCNLNAGETDIIKSFDSTVPLTETFRIITKEYGTSEDDDKAMNGLITFTNYLIKKNIISLHQTPQKRNDCAVTGEFGRYYPFVLAIELTNACSLTCKHCYKEAGSSETTYLDFNKVVEILRFFEYKTPIINITGGEPTLHPHIADIINMFGNSFKLILMTNGHGVGLINENIFKMLPKVQISMYGNSREAYEENTGSPDGFDEFVDAVKILMKNNITTDVSIVLTKQIAKNLDAYIELLISLDVKYVNIGLSTYFGRQIYGENKSDWIVDIDGKVQFASKISATVKKYEHLISFNTFTEEEVRNSHKIQEQTRRNVDNRLECGAGKTFLAISEKGLIRPCVFLPAEIFNLGELNDFSQYIMEGTHCDIKQRLLEYQKYLEKYNLSIADIECNGLR